MEDYLTQQALTITPPTSPLEGAIALPGSKSITNRALLLAALAKGTTRLKGALSSDDTRYMGAALSAMGVGIKSVSETEFEVTGQGYLAEPRAPLFLGNAGTATRFLTAAVATQKGRFTIDGDEHMRKRPIGPLVDALQRLGIDATTETGCPPVEIRGVGGFDASGVEIDGGLSSQYISAILMAAPLHRETFTLKLTGTDIGAKGYLDISLRVMSSFGAQVDSVEEGTWVVCPTGYQSVKEYAVEPDASAATYLWAAGQITGGRIDPGVSPEAMMQPDAKAWLHIQQWPNLPGEINGSQMQDAVPTLAAIAAFNRIPVRFVGIENLRVKECDRVAACCNGLNQLKPGLAEIQGDDLIVHSDPDLQGKESTAVIETYADHRIAMAFALAGLLKPGVTILDPGCVAKTYPNYWRDLASFLETGAIRPVNL